MSYATVLFFPGCNLIKSSATYPPLSILSIASCALQFGRINVKFCITDDTPFQAEISNAPKQTLNKPKPKGSHRLQEKGFHPRAIETIPLAGNLLDMRLMTFAYAILFGSVWMSLSGLTYVFYSFSRSTVCSLLVIIYFKHAHTHRVTHFFAGPQ